MGPGALHGFGAVAATILGVGVLMAADGVPMEEPERLEVVAEVAYNAQFVDIAVQSPAGTGTYNHLTRAEAASTATLGSTVPLAAYRLVPVLALVAAGARVVFLSDADLAGYRAAAVGATVTATYGGCAVVGALYLRDVTDGYAMGPELGPVIALSALAYPIVFGALGGLLAAEL